MRLPKPVGTGEGDTPGLRVHALGELEQVGEIRACGHLRNVADSIEHGQGCASVIHDLVREEAHKIRRRCTSEGWRRFGAGGQPFEKEDEGTDGSKCSEGFRVEGVQVVDDERYAKGFK